MSDQHEIESLGSVSHSNRSTNLCATAIYAPEADRQVSPGPMLEAMTSAGSSFLHPGITGFLDESEGETGLIPRASSGVFLGSGGKQGSGYGAKNVAFAERRASTTASCESSDLPFGQFAPSSPLVGKAFKHVVRTGSGAAPEEWARRRSSIAPSALQYRTAPEVMDFMESARRRASRIFLDEPEDDDSGSGGTRQGSVVFKPSGGSPVGSPRGSFDLDRLQQDLFKMVDIGSALLVDLEDQQTVNIELEAEKEQLERRVDAFEASYNVLKRQNNELKLLVTSLREELDAHEGRLPGTTTQFDQEVALAELRRAKLVSERVETARALHSTNSLDPQILEVQRRVYIEDSMWVERCNLMWDLADAAQQGWRAATNAHDILVIGATAMRRQLHKAVEARLRAETLATQQQDLYEDARRQIAERNIAIKRLQREVSSRRVKKIAAEDLGPTVKLALQKVHNLKEACSVTQTWLSTPQRTSSTSCTCEEQLPPALSLPLEPPKTE